MKLRCRLCFKCFASASTNTIIAFYVKHLWICKQFREEIENYLAIETNIQLKIPEIKLY